MRITKITVNNFKALSGLHVIETDSPMLCFVGENNTGKTTLFAAIDFLKNGISKDKSIDDYKNKNNIDKDVYVEIIIQGDISSVINNFSEPKFLPYVYYDSGVESIKLKRSSEHVEIIQNKKTVTLTEKKIAIFNQDTNQFENPTGFDAAISSLFEAQFIWSDMKAGDVVDFGSTKILGKLLKDISKDFESSQEWSDFKDAHQKAFLQSENALSKKSDTLIQDIQRSLFEFYGNASVTFDFQTPDPAQFIKLGDVFIDDGVETSISEKGSGMQRAFALSVIKVYAEYLSKHESNENLKKPFFFFIDEPEISLHPKAQSVLTNALKEISKYQQVFVATHSPYFLRSFATNAKTVNVVLKENGITKFTSSGGMNTFDFSPTLAEINYFAYDLCTEDFHNELYGYISEKTQNFLTNKFDDYLMGSHSIPKCRKWIRVKGGSPMSPEDVSLMTYIRHSIHHPENKHNPKFTDVDLKSSINEMLNIIKTTSL